MPIKRAQENGKYYYQYGESGTKYFYITNNNRSRKIAKRKAISQSNTIHANQAGGKIKKEIIPIWGGAAFRFNTQTPEKMAQLQEKYKGQAHPDFIDRYADILDGHVKMMGWRGGRSSEWYPEEHAAYLRDGSPISTTEVINMAGKQWNNMDELTRIRSGKGVYRGSGSYRELLAPIPATPRNNKIIKPAGQFRNIGNIQMNGQNG